MKEHKTVKIGDYEYGLVPMPTRIGAMVFFRIVKFILPDASFVTPTDAKSQLISFLDKPDVFEKLLVSISGRLNPDDLLNIMETVLSPCIHGTEQITGKFLDSHFAGEYEKLFELFAKALWHNYDSFFLGLPGKIEKIFQLMGLKKKNTIPEESVSTPGVGVQS